MKFGNFELFSLSDGLFRLDGGAMFGTVPQVLWKRKNAPDERNRITLGMRPLLIKTPSETLLVDTGIGDKYDKKFKDIFGIDKITTLEDSLCEAGFKPEDISIVLLTHLHFDHAGGNTKLDSDENAVPAFPNARYIVQDQELGAAINPDSRSKASYLPENFQPLADKGVLQTVSGNDKICDGVEVLITGGHTRGHQIVKIHSQGNTAVFWGDLIPTSSHLKTPYVMGYDLYPDETMSMKDTLVKKTLDENWLCIFEHEPDYGAGHIAFDGKKFTFTPIPESDR